MHSTRHILLAVLLLGLTSCTPIREAQEVVAEADSLRATGVLYADSTAMADAAATLERVRLFYPTDYAHANYYYGRILREHNDHPAAMLAFLRAVHSRTKDHAIKGRSYSNIANMCRLAAEHELAYDIYEKAAEEFLLANDSTNYFYVTNGRAYECAEMGEKESAFYILQLIENECLDSSVLSRVLETKAEACYRVEQYDSALFYISQTYAPFNKESSNLLLRAQAHSCLNNKDSAIFYATQVFQQAPSWFEMNNAYYILANDDANKTKEEALQIAGDRADVQKLIEIRQGQLSQATQLLQQDLDRKPDYTWLWTIIITVLAIGFPSGLYISRQRRQHRLISQQIVDVQTAHKKKVADEIELFGRSITDVSALKTALWWDDFDKMCEVVNNRMFGLADKLKARNSLNEKEIRLCVLVVIGTFHDKEMAEILRYGDNSIRSIKRHVANKLGTSARNLRNYLFELAG